MIKRTLNLIAVALLLLGVTSLAGVIEIPSAEASGMSLVVAMGSTPADDPGGDTTLTVRPTGGFSGHNDFTASGCTDHWECVDEVSADDDTTYLSHSTANQDELFSGDFSSLPVGATVSKLVIWFRAKRISGETTRLSVSIRVNGSYSPLSCKTDLTDSYTDYSCEFENNPNTGSPWTAAEIIGTGTEDLEYWGVFLTDYSRELRVTTVNAVVHYTE